MIDGKHCNRCDRALKEMPSLKGANFENTGIMFVLHKPDNRIDQLFLEKRDTPYEVALWTSRTGEQIEFILRHCKLTTEDVYITNLFKCVLDGNAKPRAAEYRNCLRNLEIQVEVLSPKKIVLFGNPVYRTMFSGNGTFRDFVGERLEYIGVPALVMNHPSRIWAFLDKRKAEREYERVRKFLEAQ